MPTPRDHLGHSVVSLAGGSQLWVFGGRTQMHEGFETEQLDHTMADAVEAFSLQTYKWSEHTPLPVKRGALGAAPWIRTENKTTVLLAGGEVFVAASGRILS